MHILCHSMLEVWGLHFHCNLTVCYCEGVALSLKRDFDLLKGTETVIDCRIVEVGPNAFLHCDMATSLWGLGVECGGLKENGSHRSIRSGTI